MLKSTYLRHKQFLTLACISMLLGFIITTHSPAHAQDMDRSNNVAIMSGGVGDDDLARMNAASRDYNLKLTFTSVGGEYLSDIDVVIRDKNNAVYVNQRTNGPIMLVRLAAGAYTAEATFGNLVRTQNFVIPKSGKQRTFLMRFPTQEDAENNVTTTPLPVEEVQTETRKVTTIGNVHDCQHSEKFVDGNIVRTTTCRVSGKHKK